MTLSAKGTKLNKRGLATRQQVLDAALDLLATGGPESVSASLVARQAGVTWGTVQHQFGDVDGLWAALLDTILDDGAGVALPVPDSEDVGTRLAAIVDLVWAAMDRPPFRALHQLRTALPQARTDLEAAYPQTAAAIARWEQAWTTTLTTAFVGLDLDSDRLARVRSLLPGALRGLHSEQHLSIYTDSDEARRGLIDALTVYLDPTHHG